MAEGKDNDRTAINQNRMLFTKKGGLQKEKKKQKKKKRVEIWKTLRVSHIPTRRTSNKLMMINFKKTTCIVLSGLLTPCIVTTGFIHKSV